MGVPASEAWRPCHGYAGFYECSTLGRIRAAETGRVLSTAGTDKDGYPVVSLNRFKVRKTHALHRLIALTFHGDKLNVLHNEVAHLDGNRTNARADNLKWVSKGENESHKLLHGTHPSGENHPRAKLTAADVSAIRKRGAGGEHATAISRDYPTTHHAIQKVLDGRNWRHV